MEIHFYQDINLEIKMKFWGRAFFFNIIRDCKIELPSGCLEINDLIFGKLTVPQLSPIFEMVRLYLPPWWISKNVFYLIFYYT